MRARGLNKIVVSMLHEGKSYGEIAAELNCHPAYVRATARRAGLAGKIETPVERLARRAAALGYRLVAA